MLRLFLLVYTITTPGLGKFVLLHLSNEKMKEIQNSVWWSLRPTNVILVLKLAIDKWTTTGDRMSGLIHCTHPVLIHVQSFVLWNDRKLWFYSYRLMFCEVFKFELFMGNLTIFCPCLFRRTQTNGHLLSFDLIQ